MRLSGSEVREMLMMAGGRVQDQAMGVVGRPVRVSSPTPLGAWET